MSLILKTVSLPLAAFTLAVDVEIRGRVTAIFGPSGAGKTSLLDLVAGLRRPTSAFIQLDDRVLTDTAKGVFVPARHRDIGYVPQDLALFPHLSVRQNLLYGRNSGPNDRNSPALDSVIEMLEIQPLVERGVTGLSGGEKQRVALARALLSSPRFLLLDEPLANLDMQLKARILPYLTRIRDELRLPILYVTHDRYEALALADDMVVMMEGKVVQSGPVQEIFSRPASLAVASLVIVETVQPGRIVKATDDLVSVAIGGTIVSAIKQSLPPHTSEVYVCIRAEDVILLKGPDSPSSPRNHLAGRIRSIASEGRLMRIDLDCGFPLTALLTRQACEEMSLRPADAVVALVKAPQIHLIPR